MKRKFGVGASVVVAIFLGAAGYAFMRPPMGSRAAVSFLGFTEHQAGKAPVFQLMNHTRENIAVLPGKFLVRTAGGMKVYTNEPPELFGEVPPGILPAQTSATFTVVPPAVTNAWQLELQFVEFRRLPAWQAKLRQLSHRAGLNFFRNKSYTILTPEMPPADQAERKAGP